MVLGFLAVKRVAHIPIDIRVGFGEGVEHGGGEWDTLVSGAEEDIELAVNLWGGGDGGGEAVDKGDVEGAGEEGAGVEKVGRLPAGLEGEAAEAQRAAGQGCRKERRLVGGQVGHHGGRVCICNVFELIEFKITVLKEDLGKVQQEK